ncbi:MAG: ATP phosphoribosyltransferase regulatory subunit, partial [Pseudomonadota bacterium]
LTAEIETSMEAAGLPQSGGRTASDIAARLIGKLKEARATVAPERVAQLEAFLAINVPLVEAVGALEGFADAARVDLSVAINTFGKRIDALKAEGLDPTHIKYAASFGRALDYYTGLVFEVVDKNGSIVVGGGRYDRLLEMLGAEEPVPGVGFSIWLDRVGGGAT